jgi:hypothetical protein
MEIDGDGHYSSNTPRDEQGGLRPNHPQDPASGLTPLSPSDPISAPANAPTAGPTSAPAYPPTAAPTMGQDGQHSSYVLHASLEAPSSENPQGPISTPSSAPSYAALPALTYAAPSASTSAPPSTATTTLISVPTVENDGDGCYSTTMSDVSMGESFTHPQPPASAPAPSIPTGFNPSDPDPGFVEERYNHADTDSAYDGDSFLSDTTSLKSEVTNYRIEHGRQYHGYKDGAYWVCKPSTRWLGLTATGAQRRPGQ